MAQNLGSRWLEDSLPTLWTPSRQSGLGPPILSNHWGCHEFIGLCVVLQLSPSWKNWQRQTKLGEMDETGYVKQTKIHLSVFFWGVVINHSNRERQFGVFALFFRYASVNLARCQDEDTGVSFEYIYIYISQKVFGILERLWGTKVWNVLRLGISCCLTDAPEN